MVAQPTKEGKLTKLFSWSTGEVAQTLCTPAGFGHFACKPKWSSLALASGNWGGKNMAQVTLLSRIALGACAALMVGMTAYAQTPAPATSPAPAQTPPPAPASPP